MYAGRAYYAAILSRISLVARRGDVKLGNCLVSAAELDRTGLQCRPAAGLQLSFTA